MLKIILIKYVVKNKNKTMNVISVWDLFLIKLKLVSSKKNGTSFDDSIVKRGTIEPKLRISRKAKIIVNKINIFDLKNK